MKNSIVAFLLGIFVMISIASTPISSNLFTVKPAIPSAIVITTFRFSDDAKTYIQNKYNQGFILKSCTSHHTNDLYTEIIVIMEKY